MKYYIHWRLEDGIIRRGAGAMSREECHAAIGPDPGFEYWLVPESQVDLENTRQAIAQVVHDGLWAHWMTYFFSVCKTNEDGSLTIPAGYVERWRRQMETAFADLSPQEQESDLEQADKVLAALAGETDLGPTLGPFTLHPMELPHHVLKAIVDEAFGPEGETAGSEDKE